MSSGRFRRLFSPTETLQQLPEGSTENDDERELADAQNQTFEQPTQPHIPPRELLAGLANAVADPSVTIGLHRAACLHHGTLVFSSFLACARLEQKLSDVDVHYARTLFSSIVAKASDPLSDAMVSSAVLTSFKSKAKSRINTSPVITPNKREEADRIHITRQAAAATALEALPVYDGVTSERLPPPLKPLRDLLVDLLSACDDHSGYDDFSKTNEPTGALTYVPALTAMLSAGVILYSRQALTGNDKTRRRKEMRVSLALALLGAIIGFFPYPSPEQDFGKGLASILLNSVAFSHSNCGDLHRSSSTTSGSTNSGSPVIEPLPQPENGSRRLNPIIVESLRTFGHSRYQPVDVDIEVAIRRFAHSLLLDRRRIYSDAGQIIYTAIDTI